MAYTVTEIRDGSVPKWSPSFFINSSGICCPGDVDVRVYKDS